jgi:hypothetical protein
MEFFFILGVIVVVGWGIFCQVAARQQVDVETQLSEQDAARCVVDYFGVMWTRVDGPGHLNYRPKLRMHAPTVSVGFAPDGTSSCTVNIWTSAFTTKYGMMYHAQLAWRKKLQLAGRLRNTSGASENWTRGAGN